MMQLYQISGKKCKIQVMLKFLEELPLKIDHLRDDILRPFIVHAWPRYVTPNMITVFRLFLSFAIIWMLLDYENWHSWIIVLFSVGLISDMLDGTIARTLNMKSKLGAIIDPLADKLLTLPLFFYLIRDLGALLYSIISIEVFTVFMATVAFFLSIEIKANIWGKWTFVFHGIGLLILLLFSNTAWAVPILWMAVGLGIASIIGHLYPYLSEEN
jgi:CDP-diacylglycerol--glycerol-3-phosphate 3-phosphatidyltransferase